MKTTILILMLSSALTNASIPHAQPPPLKNNALVKLGARIHSFTNHAVVIPAIIMPDASVNNVELPYPIGRFDDETELYDVIAPSEFIVVAEVRNVSLFAVTDGRGLHDINSSPVGWYEVDCSVVLEVAGSTSFNDFRFVTCSLIADRAMPYFKNRCFRFGFNKIGDDWTIASQQLVCPLPPYQKSKHRPWREILKEKTTDGTRIKYFKKIINDIANELESDGGTKSIIDISVEQDSFFVITLSKSFLLGGRACLDYGSGISTLTYDWKTGSPLHGDGLTFAFEENLLRHARMYVEEKDLWTEAMGVSVDSKYAQNEGICSELPASESVLSAVHELGRRGIEPGLDVGGEDFFEWQVAFLHGPNGRTLSGADREIFHMYKVANSYLRSIWQKNTIASDNSATVGKEDMFSFDFFSQNEMRLGTNAPIYARPNTLYTYSAVSNSITEEVYTKERLKEYLAPMRRISQ